VDVGRGAASTVLVLSSGRGGSTWLGELLNFDHRYRLIFEPFHPAQVPAARDVVYRYLPPEDPAPAVRDLVAPVLAGRRHHHWADKRNTRRVATRRLVKEIRLTNLVPWLDRQFPEMPIVFLLRHPVAVAYSRQVANPDPEHARPWWSLEEFRRNPELLAGPLAAYGDVIRAHAEDPSPLARLVLRWCLENHVPVHQAPSHRAAFVFYEDLVLRPEETLARVFPLAGRPFRPEVLDHLDEPSRETTSGRLDAVADRQALVHSWRREVPAAEQRHLLDLVAAFDLGHVYGDDALPLLAPGDLRPAPGGPA
jgi:hypothetical protein